MEIKTLQEWIEWAENIDDTSQYEKKLVAINDELIEAIAFLRHLRNHKEVQEAPIFPNEPMCKICGKISKDIAIEEPIDALSKTTPKKKKG